MTFVKMLSRMCSSRVPLIVILGATGTGKTKLSLELAERFHTEIVSADSMQLYKGLDIISAKATPQERARVPHHIIDFLHPHQTYTVVDFRNHALKVIDDLFGRNKIPIVVGGTNYYIESILWKILVEDVTEPATRLVSEMDEEKMIKLKRMKLDKQVTSADGGNAGDVGTNEPTSSSPSDNTEAEYYGPDCKLDNDVLYQRLKEVDPDRADCLHPNDRRKILRGSDDSKEVSLR